MAKFKAVIFDMDGTLLNTLTDIANSVNRGLKELGCPGHSVESYKQLIGSGRDVLAQRALPESRRDASTVERLLDLINRDYVVHWADNTSLYPGVPEMLDSLEARNLRMAILSNKPDEFTQQMARRMLSKWRFEVVTGAVPGVPVKPHPQAARQIAEKMNIVSAEVIYVGDSDVDMQMATAAGMFAVGALWGFRTRGELLANGAQAVLSSPLEILKLLD